MIDGVMYADAEVAQRVSDAVDHRKVSHKSLEKAFDFAVREFVLGLSDANLQHPIEFLTSIGVPREMATALLFQPIYPVIQRLSVKCWKNYILQPASMSREFSLA